MTNQTSSLPYIALHNMTAYEVFRAWDGLQDNEESRTKFLKTYRGSWDSRKAYAKSVYIADCNVDVLPDWLKSNIDWKALADGLFLDTVWSIDHPDCSQPECDCGFEESRCRCDKDECKVYVFTQTHSGIFPKA